MSQATNTNSHTIAVWKGFTRPIISRQMYTPSRGYYVAWCHGCGWRGSEWRSERRAIQDGREHTQSPPDPVVAKGNPYDPEMFRKDGKE